ncbi:MAG: TldD/PmbA family protein [Clostridiales bacterium]|nr:TldD/PmbA family protein [Clostridiales bacterium]
MIEELKNTAKKAIDALVNEGADKASASVSKSITHEFNVDGGEFSLFRTLFDKKLVMECLKEGRKGTDSRNRYDDESIKDSAKSCMESAASSTPDEAWDIAPKGVNEDFVLGEIKPDTDRFFFRCRELVDDIKARFPQIMLEQMIMSHKEVLSARANSNGVLFSTHQGSYQVMLMFSGHEGDKASSFFVSQAASYDLDKPFIELGSLAADLGNVEKQIETTPVQGKFEGTMVLMPSCTAELVGALVSSFASDTALLSGTSPWKDSLGEMVADERVTISLAPLDERIVCGKRVTSEDFRAENFDVIKDGRLNAFCMSLYGANKLGLKRGGNDSENLVIAPGDKSIEEIIASIDKGILVGRFSGGQPSSNGDFSGVAKNSFIIENGKIGFALSETMISGNMAAMLKNLRAISKEQVADGSTVLPFMAFDGITISGQ